MQGVNEVPAGKRYSSVKAMLWDILHDNEDGQDFYDSLAEYQRRPSVRIRRWYNMTKVRWLRRITK